jgi:hypothetical protein
MIAGSDAGSSTQFDERNLSVLSWYGQIAPLDHGRENAVWTDSQRTYLAPTAESFFPLLTIDERLQTTYSNGIPLWLR